MFAALSEYPEFFRPRMKLFMALAPAIYINNCKSKIVEELSSRPEVLKALNVLGPEVWGPGPHPGHLHPDHLGPESRWARACLHLPLAHLVDV